MTEPTVEKLAEIERESVQSKRRSRTGECGILLSTAVGAFAFSTFLVNTTPSFLIDLQITRAIHSIDLPHPNPSGQTRLEVCLRVKLTSLSSLRDGGGVPFR